MSAPAFLSFDPDGAELFAILHASAVAARPHRRRVLQLDYAARDLPGGLEWLGV